jgi:hypothetical protein
MVPFMKIITFASSSNKVALSILESFEMIIFSVLFQNRFFVECLLSWKLISWNDSMVGSMLHSSQNVLTFWWGFDIKELFPFFMIYVAVPSWCAKNSKIQSSRRWLRPGNDHRIEDNYQHSSLLSWMLTLWNQTCGFPCVEPPSSSYD